MPAPDRRPFASSFEEVTRTRQVCWRSIGFCRSVPSKRCVECGVVVRANVRHSPSSNAGELGGHQVDCSSSPAVLRLCMAHISVVGHGKVLHAGQGENRTRKRKRMCAFEGHCCKLQFETNVATAKTHAAVWSNTPALA